jgi:hypothetical protein
MLKAMKLLLIAVAFVSLEALEWARVRQVASLAVAFVSLEALE